jgi:sn-glycerol 3-phosphate transport system substrate-binding protein
MAEIRSAGTLDAVANALTQGQAPNFTLGLAPIPSANGPGGISTEAHDWLLTTGSTPERRAAAWNFLTWWNAPAQQAQWATMTGGFPDQRAAADAPAVAAMWARFPYLRQAWDLALQAPYVVDDPIGPLAGVETGTMNKMLDDLRQGTSVSATVADATSNIDDALGYYNAHQADWERCFAVTAPCP